MLLLLLAACDTETCRTTSTAVADDAVLDGLFFTAADVIALVEGTYTFDVRNAEEQWVFATLTLERGDGSAVHHDAETVRRFGAQPLFGDWSLPPPCDDEVEVPAVGTLVIEDEGVDLTYEGVVFTPSLYAPSKGGLDQVWLVAEMPVTTPGLPPPPEDATGVDLSATFNDGALESLSLQWTSEVDGGLRVTEIVDSAVTLQDP